MMPIKTLWVRAAAMFAAATFTALPASSFTTNSASFVNALNGSGGAAIQKTLTKVAGSSILVMVGCDASMSAAQRLSLGVNDGTTDYDVTCTSFGVTSQVEGLCGQRLITGLAPGTYTFTLRVRTNSGATVTLGTTGSAYIRVWEIPLTWNVASYRKEPTGSFSTNSTTNVDLLDSPGGATYTVTLTKAAGTDILIFGAAHFLQSTANNTAILAVSDGTTDYDLGRQRTFTSSGYLEATGACLITGLAPGTYTFKLRCRQTAASGSMVSGQNTCTFITAIECNNGIFAAAAVNTTATTNFTWNSNAYIDLLDAPAGNTIQRTFTKVHGPETSLFVSGTLHMVGAATAVDVTLGVNDGTTDHDVGRARVDNNPNVQIVGDCEIQNLPAGVHTLKLRVKNTGSQTQAFGAGTNSASISIMELPRAA